MPAGAMRHADRGDGRAGGWVTELGGTAHRLSLKVGSRRAAAVPRWLTVAVAGAVGEFHEGRSDSRRGVRVASSPAVAATSAGAADSTPATCSKVPDLPNIRPRRDPCLLRRDLLDHGVAMTATVVLRQHRSPYF